MYYKFLLLPFLIGLIISEKLYLVGELYVGEIVAILYLVLNFRNLRFSRFEKKIIVFALLWAVAQLISDLINNTVASDSIKGVLSPIVFVCTLTFLINYTKDRFQRLPSLLAGITIGQLIHLFLFPTEYFIGNFWKWGFGAAALGLFVIYFSFFQRNKNTLSLLIVLVIFLLVSLNFDSRSQAIFPLISAFIYVSYFGRKRSTFTKTLSGNLTGIKIAFVVLPTIFVINIGASSLFSSQIVLSQLSSDAAAKYKTQATGTYGILLGGRSEILASGQAFLDKPFLGHGSWAKDNAGYLDNYSILRQKLGYSMRDDGGYEDIGTNFLIPAHSYLMGALVWAGVFGGIFWLFLLNGTLRIFLDHLNILPFYYYVGIVNFIWNVFFSPFGANARWEVAVFLAALFAFSNNLKVNTKEMP